MLADGSRDDGPGGRRLRESTWVSDRVDETDLAVIEQLQANGRASFRSIADAVGISESAARKRVNRLIDDDVIQVVAVLNALAAEGTVITMAQLKVSGDIEAASEEISAWPECSWIVVGAGPHDLAAELVCAGREELLDVVRRLHRVPGVEDVETFLYLKVKKQLYVGPILS
jgi:Lrp/AsnC family transcriptional regulator, regulator for asnA, asnC and gidA